MTGASSSAGAAPTWSTIAAADLPKATTSDIGGVSISTGLSVSNGAVSVSYGTSAGTALQGNTNITNVAISANTTANNNYPVVFATSTTATTTAVNEGVQKSGTKLYFNPSTGNLSSTNFVGKINNITVSAATTGFTIAGGTTSKTLTVSENTTLQGGSATYLAYYNESNKIKGHGLAHFSDTYGSTTANGKNELVLGNSTSYSSNGSSYGQLALYGPTSAGTYLRSATGSSWKTATLPAATGMLAMIENGTAKGSDTKPIKIANTGLITEGSTYAGGTSITFNGVSKASTTAGFYAPTASGTANYILQSGGANQSPTWIATTNGALYATTANGAAQFGILPVAQGGTGIDKVSKNTVFAGNATTDNTAPSFRVLVANDIPSTLNSTTFSGKLTNNTFTHPLISGTGTAAVAKTSSVPGKPALWKFNLSTSTPTEGDVICIKIPCAGHGNGVFVSTDNGTTYYPVSVTGTTALTTHYINGDCIELVFLDTGGTNGVYPVAGGTATTNISGKHWLVINYYNYYVDTHLRVYTQNTGYNDDYPLLVGRTAASTLTAKANAATTDVYGVIYKTNAPTLNPSTGLMKVPGGIEVNVSSFISVSSATASTAAYSDLKIGNNANVTTTSAHSEGRLYLYSANVGAHILRATSSASDITHYFPNSTGWIATGGNGTSTGVGNGTTPVYLSTSGVLTECTVASTSTASSIVVRDANADFAGNKITANEFTTSFCGLYDNSEGGNFWLLTPNTAKRVEIDAYDNNYLRIFSQTRDTTDGTLSQYKDLKINLDSMKMFVRGLGIYWDGNDADPYAELDPSLFNMDQYGLFIKNDCSYLGGHISVGPWSDTSSYRLYFLSGTGYGMHWDGSDPSSNYPTLYSTQDVYLQVSMGQLFFRSTTSDNNYSDIFRMGFPKDADHSIAVTTTCYTPFSIEGTWYENQGCTLSVAGDTTIGGGLSVTGNTALTGTLSVTNNASFNGSANVAGNIISGKDTNTAERSIQVRSTGGMIYMYSASSGYGIYSTHGSVLSCGGNHGTIHMVNDGSVKLQTKSGYVLAMQNDGNLVLYNRSGVAKWNSGTMGT